MYTMLPKLTSKMLDEMKPGIFTSGTVSDNPIGIHMTGSDRLLRWVAVRGYGPDWCIYIHWAEKSKEEIAESGDKVYSDANIKKLVDCDEEAFSRYNF